MEKLQGLKFDGYIGSWHEIERGNVAGTEIVLLESEQWGNDICYIIAEIYKDKSPKIVVDDADSISDYADMLWEQNFSDIL